jgi:hypothetical protein
MSTKTREVIWGGRIMSAKMRAETARQEVGKLPAPPIGPRQKRGQSAWKAMAGQHSQAQPSANA